MLQGHVLKASMKDFGVDHNSWETLAQDRSAWRSAIHKGAAAYEQQRIETAKTKQAAWTAVASTLQHRPLLRCPALTVPELSGLRLASSATFKSTKSHRMNDQ